MAWWEVDDEEALQQIEGDTTPTRTADEVVAVIDLNVRLLLLDMSGRKTVHRFTCVQS
jgi:hypothetical protein